MIWIALAALVLLALAVVAVRRRRPARPTGRRPSSARPTRPGTGRPGARRPGAKRPEPVRPQPGEIWWADVPYEDGDGHKVRPCVVLRHQKRGVQILKITSQDQSHRRDHIEIPTRPWDPSADHNSFLDLSDPITITDGAFTDRAGRLDAKSWKYVCTLHSVPTAR